MWGPRAADVRSTAPRNHGLRIAEPGSEQAWGVTVQGHLPSPGDRETRPLSRSTSTCVLGWGVTPRTMSQGTHPRLGYVSALTREALDALHTFMHLLQVCGWVPAPRTLQAGEGPMSALALVSGPSPPPCPHP